MAEAMSEERLAEIRRKVTGPCSCCGYDKHDFDQPYALELLEELDRRRAQLAEIGEMREAIVAAIENLPEPEAPGGYAVPAWYGGYEDGLDAAIRIVRGEQREVPDA